MDLIYDHLKKNLVFPSVPVATVVFGAVETNQLDEENDTRTVDRPVIDPNESALMSKSLSNLAGKANQIKEDGEWGEHSGEISPQEISGKKEQIHWAPVDLSDLPPITNLILEDSILTSLETIERITENSHIAISNSPDGEQEQQQEQQHLGLTLFDLSPTSPVSPLSLNSCDFEVQIQPDNDHISQIQQTAECLQMDLMENLELLDSEEYIQKIDQMDMAAVWDVHGDEDMSCFQDCFPFFNASHVDFTMDKQATCGDGDICGGLQQFTTLVENSVKSMNVEDELRSNITYSLSHCGSSGHNNQAKQTRVTTDCYINDPQISTAVSKEGQCSISGTWTVSEHGNISGHALQELKRDLLDQSQSKNWEQHLTHNNHAPSQVKDRYYTLRDEEKKMIESGSTLNPNLEHSSPVNLISSTMEHCYGFDVPLEADGSNLFSNNGGNQSISSFEGVAQYFPAPHQNSHPRPVSTPPLNDDWLFSNIATEVDF